MRNETFNWNPYWIGLELSCRALWKKTGSLRIRKKHMLSKCSRIIHWRSAGSHKYRRSRFPTRTFCIRISTWHMQFVRDTHFVTFFVKTDCKKDEVKLKKVVKNWVEMFSLISVNFNFLIFLKFEFKHTSSFFADLHRFFITRNHDLSCCHTTCKKKLHYKFLFFD